MDRLGALFVRVCLISAGCSAVLAPLLLFSGRLRKKIAARSFYVLFLLLALRLVLPVEIRLPVPAVELPAPDLTVPVPAAPVPAQSPAVQPVPDLPAAQAPAQPAPRPAKRVPVADLLGAVWALGVVLCAVGAAGSYGLARRKLLRGSFPVAGEELALLDRLRAKLGVRRPVRLVHSANAPGPLALGLFRPVIVLPENGNPAQELVLRHELTHIRRWDVAYKLALSLACWVNWFNPLVWLMDRAAGRNLELCCDDEVTRDLSDGERRRYGSLLLDAAAVRSIPFSTCFSGGKTQMKERLLNLFTHKRNSAALVCLVLAAALLAGGLVACETADASAPGSPDTGPADVSPSPAGGSAEISPENEANRALLKDYFYANYREASASVVLADLTGDGLDEMLVLAVSTQDGDAAELSSVTAENFAYGQWQVFGVKDGSVTEFPALSAVSSSHAGWGYLYLVPRSDANGWAVLDFRPYTGQGMASYTYGVYGLEYDEWLWLDGGEAYFSLDPVESMMGPDTGDEATPEEVQALLDRAQAYRDSGAALLCFYSDGEKNEFRYLNAAPADAFAGMLDTIPALQAAVFFNGQAVQYPLPPAGAASPEEALDRLEASVEAYPDGYVFRIPNYDGEWSVHVAGRMRMDVSPIDSVPVNAEDPKYLSVHFLEDEEWKPGKRYNFDTGDATYSELTLTASVTAPDGAKAERTVTLIENGEAPASRQG